MEPHIRIGILWCLVAMLILGVGLATAEAVTVRSILATLEGYESRINTLLLQRVATEERLDLARYECEQSARKRDTLAQHLNALRLHMSRQVRLRYYQGGLSWIGDLLSGHSLSGLMLRRMYLARWSGTTRLLVRQLDTQEKAITAQQRELAVRRNGLALLKARLLDEEEQLRVQSEEKLALLAAVQQDQDARRQVRRELADARSNFDAAVTQLPDDEEVNPDTVQSLPCPTPGGMIVVGYGMTVQTELEGAGTSRGWSLRAVPTSLVTAPAAGQVAFAGMFRGYGLMAILALGQGRHLVLARLASVTIQQGDQVKQGQALGQVGQDGVVYLEVRLNGRTIPPSPLLNCPQGPSETKLELFNVAPGGP